MAIKNIQIRPKGDGSYSDVLHPETNAGQVKFADGTTVEAHKAEKASKTDFGHVKVGDRISVSNGVISADEQITPVSGEASYNEDMPGKTVITKTIAIGPGKKLGRLSAYSANVGDIRGVAFFSNINGTAQSMFSISSTTYYFSAFIDSERLIGGLGSGYSNLRNVYIDGSNLVLEFYNTSSSSQPLNCTIYWEVW